MSNAAQCPLSDPDFRAFATAEELYATLAQEITARVNASVIQNLGASMVVPGGTTPGALFDVLARSAAPWANVEITLSDDRWTATASHRTNESMVRSRLLTGNVAKSLFVPLRTKAAHARFAEADLNAAIAAMRRPFDVTVLGMGLDGHIASLLPGAAELDRALDRNDTALACAIHPGDPALGERITLTLRALLDSRQIVLLLRGPAKRDAYRWALTGVDAREAPVRAILHQRQTPVSIYWAP
jgi:6-phosphogluconolactonase